MTGAAGEAMPTGTTSGTPQVLLAHHLKQLKLPTVLRESEKVARECARDGVDHSRYLLRLVELELIDRERRMVERRIRAARFPAVKSLDTFDFAAIGCFCIKVRDATLLFTAEAASGLAPSGRRRRGGNGRASRLGRCPAPCRSKGWSGCDRP